MARMIDRARAGMGAAALALALTLTASARAAEDKAGGADGAKLSPRVAGFHEFMMASSPVCAFEASRKCVDMGWRFADSNKDGYLELEEVMAVRAAFVDWLEWRSPHLPASQRTGVAIGMLVVDTIGIPNIFAGLNTSGNGKLTKAELLKDVKLDSRPLGAVLSDPDAVDRKAIAKRVGRFAPIVSSMLGGESGKDELKGGE